MAEAHDRLDHAARVGGLLLALLAGLALGAVLLAALRSPEPAQAQQALRWHAPGFAPAGAPGPHTAHPGVPLGFVPGLDRLAPPERALLGPAP
ncbi:MAG: hypothetical protein H6702_22215 [Myxococcales bacterium]|nr:hypothetical protein [Myxococcales bacterium]